MLAQVRVSAAVVGALALFASSCSAGDESRPASAVATPQPSSSAQATTPSTSDLDAVAAPPETSADSTSGTLRADETSTQEPSADGSTTTVDPTTAPPWVLEPDAASRRGPYPVGVTTLQIPDGTKVEVWYPAVEGTTGTDTYDGRDLVPQAIRALFTGDVSSTYTIEAGRDADPASPPDGGFPVAVSSHGYAGFRMVMSFLTAHLASWGIVVVAPDHPARDLNSQLGGRVENPSDPVDDLGASLDLVTSDERFGDFVDATRVAAIGESAGGPTVVDFANSDERVVGYVAMATGRPEGLAAPDVPSLHLAGALDGIAPAEATTLPAFETAATPSVYWLIDETGHQGFTDVCSYGDGIGIIGVAEASGLGGVLDAQPQFRRLGQDGCLPPAAPVAMAHPVVRHAVTTFLVGLFGIETGLPTSLGADAAGQYDLEVTVECRP